MGKTIRREVRVKDKTVPCRKRLRRGERECLREIIEHGVDADEVVFDDDAVDPSKSKET